MEWKEKIESNQKKKQRVRGNQNLFPLLNPAPNPLQNGRKLQLETKRTESLVPRTQWVRMRVQKN